jgi:hypothetical protein
MTTAEAYAEFICRVAESIPEHYGSEFEVLAQFADFFIEWIACAEERMAMEGKT